MAEPLLKAVDKLVLTSPKEIDADDPFADRDKHRNRLRTDAILAGLVLRRLAEAFDKLPRRATATEWCACWKRSPARPASGGGCTTSQRIRSFRSRAGPWRESGRLECVRRNARFER